MGEAGDFLLLPIGHSSWSLSESSQPRYGTSENGVRWWSVVLFSEKNIEYCIVWPIAKTEESIRHFEMPAAGGGKGLGL